MCRERKRERDDIDFTRERQKISDRTSEKEPEDNDMSPQKETENTDMTSHRER